MPIRRLALGVLALVFSAQAALAAGVTKDGAVRLLGGHDFADRSYAIVGLILSHRRHPIQEELGDFYVDDPTLLEELNAQWVTGEQVPMHACGYHYTILLVRDRRRVDSFSINLETGCGTVATDAGSYRFDVALLTRHAERYRKPVMERRNFASLAEGRDYLAGLAGNRRLLLVPDPHWREYDGEVRFHAPCPGHDFGHGINAAKLSVCINRVRTEIGTKFPGETFDLSSDGGSTGNITVKMKSSKTLYARFDLYKIAYEWKDYAPSLTLHWKQAE
jgi:hypothetical protein